MSEEQRLQFLEVLFDIDDKVAFGMDDKSACKPIAPLPEWKFTQANKFCINPLKNWRDAANVTQINSLLFEMDKDENNKVIPVKEQVKMFLNSGIPYSTLVFSGTKSVHCIVRFTEPIEQKWFRSWWKAINRVLIAKGLPIDPHTMIIPQLSRVPGSIRVDKDEDGNDVLGKEQKLIHINRRVTQDEVREWLSTNGEEVREPYVPPVRLYEPDMNAQVDDKELWQAAYNMNAKKHNEYNATAPSGNWMYLIDLANYFYRVDLNLNAAISICNTEFGTKALSSSGQFFIEEPLTKGYTWAEKNGLEKIKVTSKKEWMEEKRQERMDGIPMDDILTSLDDLENEPVDINAAGISQYFRVATKYYKRIPDGTHILWDKQTINDDFGRHSIHNITEKYDDFTNQPNYMKDLRTVGTMYNLFRKPAHVPVSGEWPTIEKLLRKVFQGVGEDQYEVGLDYLQLLWTKPKQKLRVLVVASKQQETGKDTFLEFVRKLYSPANATVITAPDFELPYNSHYASKHIIMINEVKFSSMNKGIKDKIKNYVTQEKVHINGKNDRITEVDYWGRIIMATNHIDDFVEMDQEDTRYWVREMPPIKPGEKDRDFEAKIEKEIPHFIHFMINRELWKKRKRW